jgi:hypothetical protein
MRWVTLAIALLSFAALLVHFSPWTVVVLLLAGVPSFIAETKFSGDAFRLFRWRSPETRMQMYLETVLAREDSAKEVRLFGLGARFLQRYRDIFLRLYGQARALTSIAIAGGSCWGYWRRWRCTVLTRGRLGGRGWPHHARPDDDVFVAVSTGAVGRGGDAGAGAACTRTTCICLRSMSTRDTRGAALGHACRGPRPEAGISFENEFCLSAQLSPRP